MKHKPVEAAIARQSALIYLPIAVGVALLFLLAATLTGDFPLVARIGGTIWVGILSLIVAMPLVTAQVKHARRASLHR
jgi:hypothetical protein